MCRTSPASESERLPCAPDTDIMHRLLAICVIVVTVTVAQSRRWFAPEVSCWITQKKVPATWEDAQRRCERHGAVLASPLNTQLHNYLKSRINVQNDSVAYFIGTRAERSDDGQEVHYVSVEGRRLDDMPMAVFDAIKLLDLEQGDCLSMDRRGIRAVSCWDHLPYICYSNETTECGLAPATTQAPSTASTPTTTASTPTTTASTPTTTASTPTTTASTPTTTASTPTTTASTPTTTASTPTTTASTPTTTASTPTTTTSTLAPTSTIPPGYTHYAATGSSYKHHHEREVSWHVANTTCASEGAHLLVLNDAEEADIVARVVRDAGYFSYSTWTALRDSRPGGVMEWRTVHGEPLSDVFHEWGVGRPLNDVGWRCTVFLPYDKRLYDWPCDDTYYFTCEISR